jgi:hypothetical protein
LSPRVSILNSRSLSRFIDLMFASFNFVDDSAEFIYPQIKLFYALLNQR